MKNSTVNPATTCPKCGTPEATNCCFTTSQYTGIHKCEECGHSFEVPVALMNSQNPHAENIHKMLKAGYVCSPNPKDLPGSTMYPGGPGVPCLLQESTAPEGMKPVHMVQVSKFGVTILSAFYEKPLTTIRTVEQYLSECPHKSNGGRIDPNNWN